MPTTDTDADTDTVVARLRAAGCVFAEDEATILRGAAGDDPGRLHAMVARRVAGIPLEYVVGWAMFLGRRVGVAPGVFVPRQRAGFLVERAAALARPGATVVDLCCGSGALGLALAHLIAPARLYAVDVDPVAVRCAAANLAAVGGTALLGDLYDPLPTDLRGRVDVLLANVPYVPSAAIATLPPEARDHEPAVALDGGTDGLDVLRRVAATATGWLAPGGFLLAETGADQVAAACAVLGSAGLDPLHDHDPERGADVVGGRVR